MSNKQLLRPCHKDRACTFKDLKPCDDCEAGGDKELVEAIECALAISDLWTYPESECPENPTEAQALSIMKSKFEHVLAKHKAKNN